MRILIVFVLAASALMAQTKRFPIRQGAAIGGDVPAYVYEIDTERPLNVAPTLGLGEGYINPEKNCVIRLSSGGGNDYVFPPALNRTNRWLLGLTSGGGRSLQWIGPETITSSGCSATAGTSGAPPGYPAEINNWAMFWSQSEDFVAYAIGGGIGPGSSQKLYEMRCTANCTVEAATWTWTVLIDFGGNDGASIPYIDWNNKTFCASSTPPGCPAVPDKGSVYLNLSGVSPNSDTFLFSLRGTTKSEYGACMYTRSTGTFFCRYLDVNGQLPVSATPAFPGTSRKGNGIAASWDFVTAGYIAYQINGDPLVSGYVNSPRFYRKPLPNARVGDWENAESLSGITAMAHGALLPVGGATISGGGGWGNYRIGPTGEVNWIQNYTVRASYAGTITDPNVGVATKVVLMWPWDTYGFGFHITSSPRSDRGKWHLATFYREDDQASRPQRGSVYGEMILIDTTHPGLASADPSGVTPYPKGNVIRLGQHFSWCFGICSTPPGYPKQGHANLSMDGTRAVFKSNWQNGSGGGRDTSIGHSLYLIIFGSHVTW